MISNTFTINSTLDGTSGLLSKYVYDETKTNLPIAVLIHGFNLTIDAISNEILERIANQGYFAVAIGMRGRKGATGTRDASIRELHDIYDGINYIKANFPVGDKVVISGYSGGGGNALGFATKFPFVANTIVNHFGMVDYGYDDVESWYVRNSKYQTDIERFVGYSRTQNNLDYYRSRNAYESLKNVQAKVYSYHDSGDGSVSPLLTDYLTTELQRLNKNYQTKISSSTDSTRYLHNMGVSILTEGEWLPYGKTANKPTMATTGSFRVTGYIVTDEFKILLSNLDNHVADVQYDLSTEEFTITPLTGEVTVRIERNGLYQEIIVSEETTFVFDGTPIEDEPVAKFKAINQKFIKIGGTYSPIKGVFVKENGVWRKSVNL